MKILKSDFLCFAKLLVNDLGLSTHSLCERSGYYYFQFHDLLKRDKFDWQSLDTDTQDALRNMGLVFSSKGIPIGENEDSRNLAKEIKADYKREYAKLRNETWKRLAKKIEQPYNLNLFLTPGEAVSKPKQKSITVQPLLLSSGKSKFLSVPEKLCKKSVNSTKPLLNNSNPGRTIKTHDLNTNPPGGVVMPITPTGSSTPPRRAG